MTDNAVGLAGELQRLIDDLPAVLTPPALNSSAAREAALLHQRSTLAEARTLEQEIGETVKRLGKDHPDVEAAQQRSSEAWQRFKQARQAFTETTERRDAEFTQAIAQKIGAASPALLACSKLLNEALQPLLDLDRHASLHDLPRSRFLAACPDMRHALWIITATLNQLAPRRDQ